MERLLDSIESGHGSVANYLRAQGVSEAMLVRHEVAALGAAHQSFRPNTAFPQGQVAPGAGRVDQHCRLEAVRDPIASTKANLCNVSVEGCPVMRPDAKLSPVLLGRLPGVFEQCDGKPLRIGDLGVPVTTQPAVLAGVDLRDIVCGHTLHRMRRQAAVAE